MNWKDLINNVAGKLSRGFSVATKPRKYVQKSALINQFLVYFWEAAYATNVMILEKKLNKILRIICNL